LVDGNFPVRWVVFVNDKKIDLIDPNDVRAHGLIVFELPPGKHKVESKLQEDPIEKMADYITIASFLFFSFLVLREKFKLKN